MFIQSCGRRPWLSRPRPKNKQVSPCGVRGGRGSSSWFFVPGHLPMCKCCCLVFQNKPSLVESGCGLSFCFVRPVLSLRPLCLREPLAHIACDCGRKGSHWQFGKVEIKFSCLVLLASDWGRKGSNWQVVHCKSCKKSQSHCCRIPCFCIQGRVRPAVPNIFRTFAGNHHPGQGWGRGTRQFRTLSDRSPNIFGATTTSGEVLWRGPHQFRTLSESFPNMSGEPLGERWGEGHPAVPNISGHCPNIFEATIPGEGWGGAPTSSGHFPIIFRTF